MLFKRRKRDRELSEREAAGESFWKSEFGAKSRVRVIRAFSQSLSGEEFRFVVNQAHTSVAFDEGALTLRNRSGHVDDLLAYMQDCDPDEFASCVEALFGGLRKAIYSYLYTSERALYEITVAIRQVLRADRLAWSLDDDHNMTPFTSRELHQKVVVPALTLLATRKGWESVEKAYQDALQELSDDPADAITDAGTALQEAFRAAGATGKNLGALFTDARKRGLLGPSDAGLADSVKRALDWASATRSQKGESHVVSNADEADAWLMVHVIGALILWLAEK